MRCELIDHPLERRNDWIPALCTSLPVRVAFTRADPNALRIWSVCDRAVRRIVNQQHRGRCLQALPRVTNQSDRFEPSTRLL